MILLENILRSAISLPRDLSNIRTAASHRYKAHRRILGRYVAWLVLSVCLLILVKKIALSSVSEQVTQCLIL